MTFGFGQNSQSHNCACSDKNKEIKREWGSYKTFDGFAGVRVRVKGPIDACYNAINSEPNVHTFRWNIEVSGSTNCVFRVDAKSNDGQLHPFGGQIEGECIIPGEIDDKYITRENEGRMKSPLILTVNTFSNGETLNINLIKCISSSTNTNNTNQNQTTNTQQNVLTFDRNNASFQNYYKRATSAGQAGNYDEAISLWNSAISVAVNDEQRNNARAWLTEVQKAKNNADAYSQQSKNYENQKRQQEIERQKQALKQEQLQQGITQVATGITDLYVTIQAEKARKQAEARQAAIEQNTKNSQRFADADNNNYTAQLELASIYFSDSKYELAEDLYRRAMTNPNAERYQKFMVTDELITTLALQDKNNEIIELLNFYKENNANGDTKIDRIITYLQINCDEYLTGFGNCDENVISEGIKKLAKMQIYSQDIAYYAYLQVLGKHEKYGLAKNEKYGLKALDQIIHGKYDTDKPIAYYYLGMLYLQGTDAIEKDEKKALQYFMKGYERSKKELTFAPPYPAYRVSDAYFNDRILIYLKMAELYSQSTDKDDKELGILMLDRFYKFYKGLIPNSDKKYFKEFATITSTTTANNSITTKSQKISEELLEKAENILDKYKGQNPKKTTITENDQKQAIDYLKQSITLGNLGAYENLYFIYEKIGDYKSALFYINQEIQANPNAIFPLLKIGYYHQDGTGVEKNYLEAEKFYKKVLSIDDNDISANYKLGDIYKNGGYGIQQDLGKAKEFFKKPCDLIKYKEACDQYNSIK